MDFHSITELIKHNQLVAGGALVTITGVLWRKIEAFPKYITNLVKKEIYTSITISEKDESFKWISLWIQKNFKPRRSFKAYTKREFNKKTKKWEIECFKLPANGTHFTWYRGVPMWITYTEAETQAASKEGAAEQFKQMMRGDSFNISFFSYSTKIVDVFLNECKDLFIELEEKQNEKAISVFNQEYGYWVRGIDIPLRPLNSIVLSGDKQEKLIKDIKYFIENEAFYTNCSIPYRRGYLLYGPPGNGKTSTVLTMASYFNMDLYVLSLSDITSDKLLKDLVRRIGENSIVLIEDVDCAFKDRKEEHKITFSGLLNALDGVDTPPGRIMFMTTNHIDKLDEALLRPGRLDVKIEIKNAVRDQVYKLCQKVYLNKDPNDILPHIEDYKYSMAEIQEMLLEYRDRERELVRI